MYQGRYQDIKSMVTRPTVCTDLCRRRRSWTNNTQSSRCRSWGGEATTTVEWRTKRRVSGSFHEENTKGDSILSSILFFRLAISGVSPSRTRIPSCRSPLPRKVPTLLTEESIHIDYPNTCETHFALNQDSAIQAVVYAALTAVVLFLEWCVYT